MTHNTLQWRPPELQEFKSWLDLLSELQPLHHQGRSKRPHQVAMIQYTNIYCNILYIFILIIASIYVFMYLESSIIKNHQEVSRNITAERGCLASMAKLQLVSSKRWPAPPWSSPPWSHGHLYSRAMTSCDPWKNICNCNICPRWDWYQMIPSMIFRLPREVSPSLYFPLAS